MSDFGESPAPDPDDPAVQLQAAADLLRCPVAEVVKKAYLFAAELAALQQRVNEARDMGLHPDAKGTGDALWRGSR